MLYLTCTTISSVDLAQYGVSLAKDWVSVECGTIQLVLTKENRKVALDTYNSLKYLSSKES